MSNSKTEPAKSSGDFNPIEAELKNNVCKFLPPNEGQVICDAGSIICSNNFSLISACHF